MSRVKTISVTIGRKINLGDYESATAEVSIWAEMDEDESGEFLGEILSLQSQARDAVNDELKKIRDDSRKPRNQRQAPQQ